MYSPNPATVSRVRVQLHHNSINRSKSCLRKLANAL